LGKIKPPQPPENFNLQSSCWGLDDAQESPSEDLPHQKGKGVAKDFPEVQEKKPAFVKITMVNPTRGELPQGCHIQAIHSTLGEIVHSSTLIILGPLLLGATGKKKEGVPLFTNPSGDRPTTEGNFQPRPRRAINFVGSTKTDCSKTGQGTRLGTVLGGHPGGCAGGPRKEQLKLGTPRARQQCRPEKK